MSGHVRDVLIRCSLFRRMSAECLDHLAGIGQVRRYVRGERIFSQGDEPPGFFVVEEGSVRVFKTAPSGKEHVLHLAEPGQTFAEVAVLGDFPCPAHAEAAAPAVCVLLPTRPFLRLLDEVPAISRQLLAGVSRWVHQLVNLLEDVVLRDAAGRLARHLVENAEDGVVVLSALKRDLASHMNLTSETFSRTLRRLGERGLILSEPGGRIRVLDAAGLRTVADGTDGGP